ncbi:unnamed protein product, partial [Owenia fusiformis]
MQSVFIVCLLATCALAAPHAKGKLTKNIFKRYSPVEQMEMSREDFKNFLGCTGSCLSDEFYGLLKDVTYDKRWADICPNLDRVTNRLRDFSDKHHCRTGEVMNLFNQHSSLICNHAVPDNLWQEMGCLKGGDFHYIPEKLRDNPASICDDIMTVLDIGCTVLGEAVKRQCNPGSFPHIEQGVAIFRQTYCHQGRFEHFELPCMPRCERPQPETYYPSSYGSYMPDSSYYSSSYDSSFYSSSYDSSFYSSSYDSSIYSSSYDSSIYSSSY